MDGTVTITLTLAEAQTTLDILSDILYGIDTSNADNPELIATFGKIDAALGEELDLIVAGEDAR